MNALLSEARGGDLTGPCEVCHRRPRVFGLLVCSECHSAENRRLELEAMSAETLAHQVGIAMTALGQATDPARRFKCQNVLAELVAEDERRRRATAAQTAKTLTPTALENLRRAGVAAARHQGIISRHQADRPSLAALHARGLLSRSIRRHGRNAADNAYTYRLTQAGLDVLRELIQS